MASATGGSGSGTSAFAARAGAQRGQASVELVAILPLIGLLALVLWQVAVAGQAAWLVGTAARAAARAQAVGADPARAARAALPGPFSRGVGVHAGHAGVRVRVRIPAVVGGARLGAVSARAHLRAQAR